MVSKYLDRFLPVSFRPLPEPTPITASFDEFQREIIVENTRAGLKAAYKRGRRGGRPKALNGVYCRMGQNRTLRNKVIIYQYVNWTCFVV